MSSPALEERKGDATGAALILDLGIRESSRRSSKPSQEISEYKKHSLAARYWGGIPQCEEPLRHVAAEEALETFLHSLLDMPIGSAHRSPTDWFISLAIHILIVGAVVIIPFAFTQAIDMHDLRATYLTMPKPPAAPAPRPPAVPETARRVVRPIQSAMLTMPTVIPKKIMQIKDDDVPDLNPGGVVGGVPGGEIGGVLGGILGGSAVAPPPPAAPKKTVYRVGGIVKPPREISRVQPNYSPIARQAHVEGVVMIDAIIDENGDVVQARAVSGPGLLMASALRAVMQWKYEPTYLDGTPVSISMEVQVNFHLR